MHKVTAHGTTRHSMYARHDRIVFIRHEQKHGRILWVVPILVPSVPKRWPFGRVYRHGETVLPQHRSLVYASCCLSAALARYGKSIFAMQPDTFFLPFFFNFSTRLFACISCRLRIRHLLDSSDIRTTVVNCRTIGTSLRR